jgi:hypothetical protein
MYKNKSVIIACLSVAIVTFLFFLPSRSGDFIIQDDSIYVVANPLIRQLDLHMIWQAFSQAHFGWWMPLTWISFAVDYHFWDLNPLGYHLHNILLHGVNAALAVLVIHQLLQLVRRSSPAVGTIAVRDGYGYASILIVSGLLWGVHPLRVESVAWVAERKDVLNGIFAFGAIILYLQYAAVRTEGRSSACWYYGGAVVMFALSLMAKGSSVGLALMLLVLDWYPLDRLRRDTVLRVLLEKVPFLIIATASALATVYFVRENAALIPLEAFPLSQRFVVSGNSLWEYWRLFFFPHGLTPLHVIPDPVPLSYGLKAAAVTLILGGVLFATRLTWLKATVLCFILPVFPVLGFFQNGDQAYAARFIYLASLAQVMTVAGLLYWLLNRDGNRYQFRLAILIAVVFLGGAMMFSVTLFRDWRNTESYWSSIIAREPLAIHFKERGRHYFTAGRYDAAIADFTAALERASGTLQPYIFNLYAFRAEACRMAGRPDDAVRDYTRAIAAFPHPSYFYHRGLALRALGRSAEADEDIRRAGPDPGPISWYD